MSQFDWSITEKNETMEAPKIEGFVSELDFSLH
jgi:hypothetical protein